MQLEHQDRAAGARELSEGELFAELKGILERQAHFALGRRRRSPTFRTSDLVNEAVVEILEWSRDYVTAPRLKLLGARAIRQILYRRAKSLRSTKRIPKELLDSLDEGWDASEHLPGGGRRSQPPVEDDLEWVLIVEQTMRKVGEVLGEECLQVLEGRFFVRMTEDELSQALGVSVRTVQRRRQELRAYVHGEFGFSEGSATPRKPRA